MDSDSDSNLGPLTRSKATSLESNIEFSVEKVPKKSRRKCVKTRIKRNWKNKETSDVEVSMDDLSQTLLHRVFNELKQDLEPETLLRSGLLRLMSLMAQYQAKMIFRK